MSVLPSRPIGSSIQTLPRRFGWSFTASNVSVSGKKRETKTYWRYTGYPGGLRISAFKDTIAKNPEFVIMHAVKGMLPHNRLGRRLLKKLKVYAGPEHPHSAQKPQVLEL